MFRTTSENLKLNRTEQKPKINTADVRKNSFRQTAVAAEPTTGLANLWHPAFSVVPIFYISFVQPASLYHARYVYIHISDCVQMVYELPLLANKTASETLLHKLGAVRSVDWTFIIGAPVWRWLGEYVTLDKAFYNLLMKQEVAAAPVTATFSLLLHSSWRSLLEM